MNKVVNPILDSGQKYLSDKTKLQNLVNNIIADLEKNPKLRNLDSKTKDELRNIARDAQEWIKNNPNATPKELKDYIASLYKRLGSHTNYKFSVWAPTNYAFGFGSNYVSEDLKWGRYVDPNKEKPSYYYGSYLGDWEKKKKRKS